MMESADQSEEEMETESMMEVKEDHRELMDTATEKLLQAIATVESAEAPIADLLLLAYEAADEFVYEVDSLADKVGDVEDDVIAAKIHEVKQLSAALGMIVAGFGLVGTRVEPPAMEAKEERIEAATATEAEKGSTAV